LTLISWSIEDGGLLVPKWLKRIFLNVPEIENQKLIADILSAYDDLIENNQKQI